MTRAMSPKSQAGKQLCIFDSARIWEIWRADTCVDILELETNGIF